MIHIAQAAREIETRLMRKLLEFRPLRNPESNNQRLAFVDLVFKMLRSSCLNPLKCELYLKYLMSLECPFSSHLSLNTRFISHLKTCPCDERWFALPFLPPCLTLHEPLSRHFYDRADPDERLTAADCLEHPFLRQGFSDANKQTANASPSSASETATSTQKSGKRHTHFNNARCERGFL